MSSSPDNAAQGSPPRPPMKLFWAELGAALIIRPPAPAKRKVRGLPRGDGHPVLVIPAFLASDLHTRRLRHRLLALGYQVQGWGLGMNIGPTEVALAGIAERLMAEALRSGQRISLIGHSLGGVFARALALRYPEQVRGVITLCSPFVLPTSSNVMPIYKALGRFHARDSALLADTLARPLAVPLTAIYSKRDGIVPWTNCIDRVSPLAENIEVRGAHTTMPGNAIATRIIAERLARPDRPDDAWTESLVDAPSALN